MSGRADHPPCRRCNAPTCEHHALLARAFGLKGAELCFDCLATGLAVPGDELADATLGYLAHRDCYLREWQEIGRCARGGEGLAPVCLSVPIPAKYAALAEAPPAETAPAPGRNGEAAVPDWDRDAEFDGGDTGCGDLLFDLRIAVRPLAAGARILVTARDAGAPIDLPAWCRLTGNPLLRAEHPHYLIERKPSG